MDNKDTDTNPVEGSEEILPNNDESQSESIKVNVIQPKDETSDTSTDAENKAEPGSSIKIEEPTTPANDAASESKESDVIQDIAIPPTEEAEVAVAPEQEETVETYTKEVVEASAPMSSEPANEALATEESHPNIANSNASVSPVPTGSISNQESSQGDIAKLKKSNKKLKILSSILILLFVAIASAGIVAYTQKSSTQQELDAANQKNAALEQQIQDQHLSASQVEVDKLSVENGELQKTIEEQQALINQYEAAAKKLKEACAKSCSGINVPTDTTGNEATPPPSNTQN